jgi:hypothetical protein
MQTKEDSADLVAFKYLLDELPDEDPAKAAAKLKRKLSRKKIAYDALRCERVRAVHEQLMQEVHKTKRSRYYRGPTSQYAVAEDFDIDAMVGDYVQSYPQIEESDLRAMILLGVFAYYVR